MKIDKDKIFNSLKDAVNSRRFWAAVLSIVALISALFNHLIVVELCTSTAAILGLDSYMRPSTRNTKSKK